MFQAQGAATGLHIWQLNDDTAGADHECGKAQLKAACVTRLGHDSGGSSLHLTCSALLARAMMLAGSPALTMQDTSAEGMDSLGTMVISYRSRVLREAMGSASTVHLPEYSCTRRGTMAV